MLASAIIGVVRRRISQTDLPTSNLTDEDIMDYLSEAVDMLTLRNIAGMDTLVVDTVGISVTPEPTLEQGYMLAIFTVLRILQDEYSGKLYRGELAVSWSSGLESETTISAEKAWKQALDEIEEELDRMILVKRAPQTGTRSQ